MAQEKSGKFKLGIVNGTPVNTEHEYTYREFQSREDVESSADWTWPKLLEAVNQKENATARALAYQVAAKATGLMPDPADPAVKRLTAIKNLVSLGVPKEIAEQTIDATLAAMSK